MNAHLGFARWSSQWTQFCVAAKLAAVSVPNVVRTFAVTQAGSGES